MNKQFVDTTLLEDYLDGKLDAKAMHFVERLSLEDPFVGEALEGLRQATHRRQTLSLLQKQLAARVAQLPVKRKVWGITTFRLSVAATAAVLFVTASIVFWMQEENGRVQQEGMAGKKVDVKLTPILDTIVADNAIAAKRTKSPLNADSFNSKQGSPTVSVRQAVEQTTNQADLDRIKNAAAASPALSGDSNVLASVASAKVAAAKERATMSRLAVSKAASIDTSQRNKIITTDGVFINRSTSLASPVGGIAAFEKYILNAHKPTGVGSVYLEFMVGKEGIPERFNILRSQGRELDEKAIELVKKGPKWVADGSGLPVRYTISM